MCTILSTFLLLANATTSVGGITMTIYYYYCGKLPMTAYTFVCNLSHTTYPGECPLLVFGLNITTKPLVLCVSYDHKTSLAAAHCIVALSHFVWPLFWLAAGGVH